MYLSTCTRPDITHAVYQLSKHMINPHDVHFRLAKHVLRYLKGNMHTLTYRKQSTFTLVGYVDADFAGDLPSRKSTTGYVFTLAGTAISWLCKLQPIVATSTTYAEYIALTTAAQEAVALKRLAQTLGLQHDEPVPLFEDNEGAISISEHHGAQSAKSKHFEVRYHYVRELMHTKQISVHKIHTSDNAADLFTKALGKHKHMLFKRAIMGILMCILTHMYM